MPRPPTELVVGTRTTDGFTLTWTAPESGTFTGYKVTVGAGDDSKTETPAKDATSVKVTGLSAGTEYPVNVITVNQQDESLVLTEKVSTCEF